MFKLQPYMMTNKVWEENQTHCLQYDEARKKFTALIVISLNHFDKSAWLNFLRRISRESKKIIQGQSSGSDVTEVPVDLNLCLLSSALPQSCPSAFIVPACHKASRWL